MGSVTVEVKVWIGFVVVPLGELVKLDIGSVLLRLVVALPGWLNE